MRDITLKMKSNAPTMAASSHQSRNNALLAIKKALIDNKDRIFSANSSDVSRAKEEGLSEAVIKRLIFNEGKLNDVCQGIDQLVALPDPLGKIDLKRSLDDDLILTRISVPIGILGVIFEARPDAMIQIASLCIKSGNCAILKGGSETQKTNSAVFSVIHDAAVSSGLPKYCLARADSHSQIDELLACDDVVDLIIPRGSNSFVKYIMDHTSIPVMGHSDGICHTYIDAAADPKKAVPIVIDAKLQYTAACNATETLLIDRSYPAASRDALIKSLTESGIVLRGDAEIRALYDDILPLTSLEYDCEYLESELSVKLVEGVTEAVDHINTHGSHHTDCIITEDDSAADQFLMYVDSAGVYRNASTRFADGFRYGFGAEVGISTGKLHARGPVGLEGLCTYKYLLSGGGNIVGDYAEGRKKFNFKDL